MVFVEKGGVPGQAGGDRLLEGEIVLLPVFRLPEMPEPREDALRVGVHHENRPPGGVEDDGVRRLPPDALEPQKRLAQRFLGQAQEAAHVPFVTFAQPGGESLDPSGLHVEEPRGADEAGEAAHARFRKRALREESRFFEVRNRLRRVRPGGVLHQNRAHADLERGLAGPPLLRAEAGVEAIVDVHQALSGDSGWSLRFASPPHARLAPAPGVDFPVWIRRFPQRRVRNSGAISGFNTVGRKSATARLRFSALSGSAARRRRARSGGSSAILAQGTGAG